MGYKEPKFNATCVLNKDLHGCMYCIFVISRCVIRDTLSILCQQSKDKTSVISYLVMCGLFKYLISL